MLLMMSENIARNMYSSQGTINYHTQLHHVGHFRKTVLWRTESWISRRFFCPNSLKFGRFTYGASLRSDQRLSTSEITWTQWYRIVSKEHWRNDEDRVKAEYSHTHISALTLRRLMSYIYIYIYIYIYGAPILDVSRSHTTTQHSR